MKENKSLDMLTPLLQLYPCSLQLQSCDITAVPALAWLNMALFHLLRAAHKQVIDPLAALCGGTR